MVTRVTIFVRILSLNVPSRFCCKKMYEKNSQPLCLSVLYSKSLQSYQSFWTLNILLPVDIILHGSIWPIRHFSIKVSFLKYFLNINHSCFVLHFFFYCIELHCFALRYKLITGGDTRWFSIGEIDSHRLLQTTGWFKSLSLSFYLHNSLSFIEIWSCFSYR